MGHQSYLKYDPEELRREAPNHPSIRAAAKALGWPERTARRYAKRYGILAAMPADLVECSASDLLAHSVQDETLPVAASVSVDEYVKLQKKILRLEETNSLLRKTQKSSFSDSNIVEEMRESLLEAANSFGDISVSVKRVKQPGSKRSDAEIEINVYVTDWHFGEIVRPEHTGGLNEYDPMVASRRAYKFVSVVNAWLTNYRNLHPIHRVNICFLGDNVSGMHNLHPEQADEYARIGVQVLDAAIVFAQVVRDITVHAFGLGAIVRVLTVNGGNHARSTKKMPRGIAAMETSWETMLHEMLPMMLQSLDIEWCMGRSYGNVFEAAGRVFLLQHGDAIKGLSTQSTHKAAEKEIMKGVMALLRNGSISQIPQEIRIGHFHEELKIRTATGSFRVNPSAKGTDAWVFDALGKAQPPEQFMEAIHPEHGVIAENVIALSDPGCDGYAWGACSDSSPAVSLIA